MKEIIDKMMRNLSIDFENCFNKTKLKQKLNKIKRITRNLYPFKPFMKYLERKQTKKRNRELKHPSVVIHYIKLLLTKLRSLKKSGEIISYDIRIDESISVDIHWAGKINKIDVEFTNLKRDKID